MLERGYVQLYTGNGKGKTTAALGLAMRAAGAGLKSIILQFMKGQQYGELDAATRFDGLITIEQYGSDRFCTPDSGNREEHYRRSREGIARSRAVLCNEAIPIVILDEIVTACLYKLVTLDEILDLIKIKPPDRELILTGRGAPPELIEACDLVTEMKEIKHYYMRGIEARRGIEY